ncbi:MAG: hypothetical protein Q8S33_36060 [Myxococcales bacterium]|nr:hypothetical protein [Myxococcales bacterium]MDP3505815.1 hypothetical protein [Myxococcales bacterium]
MHNGEASVKQTDSSAKARARQLQLFRAMSPQERLELALSMSESTRELSLTGLQKLHPDESDLQLRIRLAALLYGATAQARITAALARRCP